MLAGGAALLLAAAAIAAALVVHGGGTPTTSAFLGPGLHEIATNHTLVVTWRLLHARRPDQGRHPAARPRQ
jgi:hypothetical protein